jgi:nicotinate-nucleotide adenylyltransferase
MIPVLVSSFDPVSQKEIEAANAYRREHRLRDLYLAVSEEGVLSKQLRTGLLKKALAPYRHLHVTEHAEDAVNLEPMDEEKIRSGVYRRAAYGIRRDLITEGYYLNVTAKAMCNPHRYAHTCSVAQVCRELAAVHQMDEKKAWVMGMLHDLTKGFSDEANRKIIEIYKPEWLTVSPKVWHSYTGVIYAKQSLCLADQDIAYAMEHHTIGDGHTEWAYLLYIADKIEPLRGYDVSKQRALAEKDLKAAANLIREESKAYILETEGIHV